VNSPSIRGIRSDLFGSRGLNKHREYKRGGRGKTIGGRTLQHRVVIRMPGVAPLNRCIRVSVRPAADMDLFESALPQVLKTID
jgi:histidinol-phosphate/aromatic aminotransferase/cobyric acid decarboxylase-like protein